MPLTKAGRTALRVAIYGAVPAFLSITAWGIWLRNSTRGETYDAMMKAAPACGAGAVRVTDRWGDTGHSVSCSRDGALEGPWEAWDNARLHQRGEYKAGKKTGTWLVYNPDGSVYRTIRYEAGQEVSNVITDHK